MKKLKFNHRSLISYKEKLLISRENLYNNIKSYMDENKKGNCDTFVLISFNYPGVPKYNRYFNDAIRYLIIFFENFFTTQSILNYKLFISFAGSVLLINIKQFPIILKNICYNIEKNCRFFDIDIVANKRMITSMLVGLNQKNCIICGRNTNICRIKKKHTTRILRKRMNYLLKNFCFNFNSNL